MVGPSMRHAWTAAALDLALVASKWIWKSQCNESGGRERAGKGGEKGRGSAKDVFGVRLLRSLARPLARSLAAAFWKMDRVTLRPRRLRRRFLFARAVSGFFLSEVNFPFGSSGSSIFGGPFSRRNISTVR